jgi:poly(3-hydroxybutyrate) depolymerase
MLTGLSARCDVFTLIWSDPASIPATAGGFGLDDNIDAVIYALQLLGEKLHVIGVCQSALPVLAAAAILSASGTHALPASLALLGGKLDTNIAPTRLDRLARQYSLDWFNRYLISPVPDFRAGAGRQVYSAEAQALALYTYIARQMLTFGEVFQKIMHDDGDDPAARPFLGLLAPVAIPAEFFLDTVHAVFHESLLARGRLRWRGLPVAPAAIRNIALLTLEAGLDDVAGPGQTRVAQTLCTSLPAALRLHVDAPAIGHFGLFHGAVWRRSIMPRLLGFFRQATSGSFPSGLPTDGGQDDAPAPAAASIQRPPPSAAT